MRMRHKIIAGYVHTSIDSQGQRTRPGDYGISRDTSSDDCAAIAESGFLASFVG